MKWSELRRVMTAERRERIDAIKAEALPAESTACFRCGSTDATFGPDPYQSDVNGDGTEVWECAPCRETSSDDI